MYEHPQLKQNNASLVGHCQKLIQVISKKLWKNLAHNLKLVCTLARTYKISLVEHWG